MERPYDHESRVRAELGTGPHLFHGHGTRSLRVAWLLAEMGVPHQTTLVPFPPRLKQPEFLATNPAGSLPFFVDGGVKMTESVAICLYLVEVHGPTVLAVSPAEAGFADYLQWCFYGEATLTQPLGSIMKYRHLERWSGAGRRSSTTRGRFSSGG